MGEELVFGVMVRGQVVTRLVTVLRTGPHTVSVVAVPRTSTLLQYRSHLKKKGLLVCKTHWKCLKCQISALNAGGEKNVSLYVKEKCFELHSVRLSLKSESATEISLTRSHTEVPQGLF